MGPILRNLQCEGRLMPIMSSFTPLFFFVDAGPYPLPPVDGTASLSFSRSL